MLNKSTYDNVKNMRVTLQTLQSANLLYSLSLASTRLFFFDTFVYFLVALLSPFTQNRNVLVCKLINDFRIFRAHEEW